MSRWAVRCALEALKVLTNVALIDLGLVQQSLGSVSVQAEFSHVALQVYIYTYIHTHTYMYKEWECLGVARGCSVL